MKILISLVALASASAASASITPVLIGSPTATGNGDYAYNYRVTLASDQGLMTGNYFTLYDFSGFNGFGAAGTGFTGSTNLVGPTPNKTVPTDDPGILNVTFTYSGPTINYNGALMQRDLGTFTVFGTSGTVVFNDFTSLAVLNAGPTKGTPVATIGSHAIGVGGGSGNPSTVPEPATWATMLLGLGFVGVSARRRGTSVAA